MKQIPLYSIVIFPDPEQIMLIKSYKQLLKKNIGWFGSVNSDAHITLINFENEFLFHLYINQIRQFCRTIIPKKVVFKTFESFGTSTFYIAPDKTSQFYLDKIIVDLHNYLNFKINNTHAHLTIARSLDSYRIKSAFKLFSKTEINFEFLCDSIYVRKFNELNQQYSDIIEKIDFFK
ncbi:2'-5' RNA ligase family protein [Flavobacterium sp. SUN052]|uniref:2'-5' RNA ligase family protein n=1 Tax=Flavobacterium sp. SUN052 TaxID=3002441 RepID=UPI00237ED5F7|nr:2'-5' RNA ligase family protein [Flavobacterium sp. SUN052]MEC4005776.1 2'-5' RNA ligase family protein [Flavobacterium sp. SUN052]